MNKVELIGRLTKDPSVKTSGELTIARYTLAVDRRFKKDGEQAADFISCVAFGKAGDFAEKYLHKGTKIAVCGRIQTGSYEKDGRTIYTTDVVAEEQEFVEPKKDSDKKTTGGAFGASDFMSIPDGIDEELPFN